MTLERCRRSLTDLLADPENRVIALSGKWGTGKSRLWEDVQKASPDKTVKEAVYVSLFGLRNIGELRLKIAQGALSSIESGGAAAARIAKRIDQFRGLLKSFNSGFSALEELGLLVAPLVTKDRFIVIDDIERKHESLQIEEILGFIDDSVQKQGCRMLLILNSDQLEDRGVWETLREKVIDQELRLDTSPAEAFSIAAVLTATPYAQQVGAAIGKCQVTNIRIIRKIIRVVNHLLGCRGELPQEVLSRTIPSTTLLSAIHYKGIEDGPDFQFVLDIQKHFIASVMNQETRQREEETPERKEGERWRLLLDQLGIRGVDEYEAVVIAYLKSGLVESAKVGVVLDGYLAEGRRLTTRARVQEFYDHCIWHPNISDGELLQEAEAIRPDVRFLEMFAVSDLCAQVAELDSGAQLAERLLAEWLAAFREQYPSDNEPDIDADYNPFNRTLHPDISAEIQAMQKRRTAALSVLDVCRKYVEDRGWGSREESFMRSVTSNQYEAEIRGATGKELRILLLQNAHFLKSRHNYDAHFGGASRCFLDACRAIVNREPESKLSVLIGKVFADA